MRHARVKKQSRVNPAFRSDYFEKIDSPDKAYWLGYLYNVAKVRDDGYFFFSRSLTMDFEALARFSIDTNLTSDIFTHSIKRKKGITTFITYYLSFMSQEFIDGFYGYFPGGDSFINTTPRYPNISPEYNRDFIRGLFESYSSIIKVDTEKNQSLLLRIDGHPSLLEGVERILKEEIEITASLTKRSSETNRFSHALVFTSKLMLPDLILYLYHDNVRHYNVRKYEQLLEIFRFLYK